MTSSYLGGDPAAGTVGPVAYAESRTTTSTTIGGGGISSSSRFFATASGFTEGSGGPAVPAMDYQGTLWNNNNVISGPGGIENGYHQNQNQSQNNFMMSQSHHQQNQNQRFHIQQQKFFHVQMQNQLVVHQEQKQQQQQQIRIRSENSYNQMEHSYLSQQQQQIETVSPKKNFGDSWTHSGNNWTRFSTPRSVGLFNNASNSNRRLPIMDENPNQTGFQNAFQFPSPLPTPIGRPTPLHVRNGQKSPRQYQKQQQLQQQEPSMKTWKDAKGVTYGYDEEGNKILIPPPPPGFGSPVRRTDFAVPSAPSSPSESVITNEMMKELQDRLIAMIDSDDDEKSPGKKTPSGASPTAAAVRPENISITSFAASDPAKVARDLDTIFFTLQNSVSSDSPTQMGTRNNEKGQNGRQVSNASTLTQNCINTSMKDQYSLCIANLMNSEEMTVMLQAMNFAYFGPHQITHGSSAVLPENSLFFWTQVRYEFLEAMISISPEFFYSIPWKEYASHPDFSTDSYHKLAALAAQMRMKRESPAKRGSSDSSADGSYSGSPTKRFKSPISPMSPPARTQVYDPVNNAYVYECVFCKGNDQPEEMYKSHPIRVGDKVICPLLRKYKCRLCGACDDNAHTIKYCPANVTGFFATYPGSGGNRGLAFGQMMNSMSRPDEENARLSYESGNRAVGNMPMPTNSAVNWEHASRQVKPPVVRKLNFDMNY